jgi:hypothetical protein
MRCWLTDAPSIPLQLQQSWASTLLSLFIKAVLVLQYDGGARVLLIAAHFAPTSTPHRVVASLNWLLNANLPTACHPAHQHRYIGAACLQLLMTSAGEPSPKLQAQLTLGLRAAVLLVEDPAAHLIVADAELPFHVANLGLILLDQVVSACGFC